MRSSRKVSEGKKEVTSILSSFAKLRILHYGSKGALSSPQPPSGLKRRQPKFDEGELRRMLTRMERAGLLKRTNKTRAEGDSPLYKITAQARRALKSAKSHLNEFI